MLANATDLFSNLDQSMPKFDEWLQVRVAHTSRPCIAGGFFPPSLAPPTLTPPSPPPLEQEAMGINATATLQEYSNIWLPMPSNTTNGALATESRTRAS